MTEKDLRFKEPRDSGIKGFSDLVIGGLRD